MREDQDDIFNHDFIRRVDIHIAEENALFKSVKLASVTFSALMGILIGLLIWVFAEKNADIRAMQFSINQHSLQINETLTLLKAEIDNGKRDREVLEKHIDSAIDYRVNGNGKK